MGAAKPRGKVPDQKGVTATPPVAKEEVMEVTPPVQAQGVSKDATDVLDESDLSELKESKTIPYDRFKEVNEKFKATERKLKEYQEQSRLEMERAIRDAELRAREAARMESNDLSLDLSEPWEKEYKTVSSQMTNLKSELESLKAQHSEQLVQNQLKTLETRYPEADTLAVLGWKKSSPSADLEELMELSHRRNVERAESRLQKIIEKKKQKAKAPSFLTNSMREPIFKSDEERPKTIRDATKTARKWFDQQ